MELLFSNDSEVCRDNTIWLANSQLEVCETHYSDWLYFASSHITSEQTADFCLDTRVEAYSQQTSTEHGINQRRPLKY